MDLSIIIVNWNVKDLLEKCLASIYEETRDLDFEVIVADNASSDGSVEMVKEKFPQVKLIANKENRWFAGGNNQGLKIARGKLILLLNPDTVVLSGAIDKMVTLMNGKSLSQIKINDFEADKENSVDEDKRDSSTRFASQKCEASLGQNDNNKIYNMDNVGVLGCKLLNPDMTLQPSCRRLPRIWDQTLVLLKLHNFFPRLKSIREYYMLDFKHNEEREVEQVMGACFMIRKEIIDKIGGMDEKYGSIFEEVDLCKRVIDEEWKIFFTAQAQVIHHKGQSFRQRKIITNQKNFNHALLRYFKKYKPLWQYLILLLLWPVSMGLAVLDQVMIILGIRRFKARFKKKEM